METIFAPAVSAFGVAVKQKLANIAASGEPEDQLRAPFEQLLRDLAKLAGFAPADVAAVGESAISALKTRPDYAVTVHQALVGHVELKAPGKGADPRRFRDPHDRKQWEKLKSLPNLLYADGNEFALWRNSELVGTLVRLTGDVASSGSQFAAPPGLLHLFEWAVATRRPSIGLLHHPDGGSQYASEAYRELLHRHGVTPSMSRAGNCYDNAKMDGFWATLKGELIDDHVFATCAEAKSALFAYIEIFYNWARLDGALGFTSPVDFEQNLNQNTNNPALHPVREIGARPVLISR